jgi:hypothetical protein
MTIAPVSLHLQRLTALQEVVRPVRFHTPRLLLLDVALRLFWGDALP